MEVQVLVCYLEGVKEDSKIDSKRIVKHVTSKQILRICCTAIHDEYAWDHYGQTL